MKDGLISKKNKGGYLVYCNTIYCFLVFKFGLKKDWFQDLSEYCGTGFDLLLLLWICMLTLESGAYRGGPLSARKS